MKKKIFVADDNPDILEIVSSILEHYGYVVERSHSAKKLLNLKGDLPDLILLDIRMSGEDGSEICKKLKQLQHTKHLPVILVSANNDLATTAKLCYADGYISKPFNINELLLKVEQYLV